MTDPTGRTDDANELREEVFAVDAIKPRFVVDEDGQPVSVLLDIQEYRRLLEAVEELDDIRAYDAAKRTDDEAVPFEEAVAEIERRRKTG